jgi:predicted nucleotidyltransferase
MKKRDEIIKRLKNFFRDNADRYGIEMAFLFGSWVKGFPRIDSDVDVAVIFCEEDLLEEEVFDRLTEIAISIGGQIKQEVNIMEVRRNFKKPMLYYNAIVLGLPIFIRSFIKYVDLKNEAIRQMEDFSLFGLSWQIEVAKKNLETVKNAGI